jgi:FkbM family methyltransferase
MSTSISLLSFSKLSRIILFGLLVGIILSTFLSFEIKENDHVSNISLLQSVKRLSEPFFWCRSNPFIKKWNDSHFQVAAASVVEYRSSIVFRTHEMTWNAHHLHTHKPFDSLPSVVPCADEVYTDTDAKVICGLSHLTYHCIIYSLGSNGNFIFEEAVSESTPCEIHTFDCTVSEDKLPSVLPSRVTYHSICLGSDDDVTSKYRSLGSIMKEFGHKRVDLLKMDIEGFEFQVVEALYASFLREGGRSLPHQISFEQHYRGLGDSNPAWSNYPLGLSAGDMAVLWVDLTDMGYILAGRNDNPGCLHCSELSAIRAFCND